MASRSASSAALAACAARCRRLRLSRLRGLAAGVLARSAPQRASRPEPNRSAAGATAAQPSCGRPAARLHPRPRTPARARGEGSRSLRRLRFWSHSRPAAAAAARGTPGPWPGRSAPGGAAGPHPRTVSGAAPRPACGQSRKMVPSASCAANWFCSAAGPASSSSSCGNCRCTPAMKLLQRRRRGRRIDQRHGRREFATSWSAKRSADGALTTLAWHRPPPASAPRAASGPPTAPRSTATRGPRPPEPGSPAAAVAATGSAHCRVLVGRLRGFIRLRKSTVWGRISPDPTDCMPSVEADKAGPPAAATEL
jgi:hypothetical protein